jgi:UDP-N-acetylmuramoylalanine--D-glutamate ligase
MDFTARRIALAGFGQEGRSTYEYLLAHGATDVTILDRRADIRDLPRGAKSVLGPEYLSGLEAYEVIFRSPGLPLHTSELQGAQEAGVYVTSHTRLFFELRPQRIIGISGTKGKGTTAGLVKAILEEADMPVRLGGNIGTPPLSFVDQLHEDDWVVLELSSFQLEDATASPEIAILTNLTADHLDYHGTIDAYHAAKSSLVKFQSATGVALFNIDDAGSKEFAERYARGSKRWFSTDEKADAYVENESVYLKASGHVCATAKIPLPGKHNLHNVLAASLAAEVLGVKTPQMAEAIQRYRGLPYHLEVLGSKQGVTYVNDSYATSPTATIPALESFNQPTILIAGGADKGIDYGELGQVIINSPVKALVLIRPVGDAILRAVQDAAKATQVPAPHYEFIAAPEEILPACHNLAKEGDVVLLSPAAASFGLFQDYRDRGRFFSEAVASVR